MTQPDFTLMFETLKDIQARLGRIEREVNSHSVQLTAIGQQLGALTTAVYGGHGQIDELKARIERVERRLELRDEP